MVIQKFLANDVFCTQAIGWVTVLHESFLIVSNNYPFTLTLCLVKRFQTYILSDETHSNLNYVWPNTFKPTFCLVNPIQTYYTLSGQKILCLNPVWSNVFTLITFCHYVFALLTSTLYLYDGSTLNLVCFKSFLPSLCIITLSSYHPSAFSVFHPCSAAFLMLKITNAFHFLINFLDHSALFSSLTPLSTTWRHRKEDQINSESILIMLSDFV